MCLTLVTRQTNHALVRVGIERSSIHQVIEWILLVLFRPAHTQTDTCKSDHRMNVMVQGSYYMDSEQKTVGEWDKKVTGKVAPHNNAVNS